MPDILGHQRQALSKVWITQLINAGLQNITVMVKSPFKDIGILLTIIRNINNLTMPASHIQNGNIGIRVPLVTVS